METETLRLLADAIDKLAEAKESTRIGFIEDDIETALNAIKSAVKRTVAGDTEGE